MRTSGIPSASTVASDMAFGSRGSASPASSNQACEQPQRLVGLGEITSSLTMSGVQSGPCRTLRGEPWWSGVGARVPRRPRYKGTRKARLWRLRACRRSRCALALGAATRRLQLLLQARLLFMGKATRGRADRARSAPAATRARRRPRRPRTATSPIAARGRERGARPRRQGRQRAWENPATGARGTVTPIADAYTPGRLPPAATSSRATSATAPESWLQGDACRMHQGKWRCAGCGRGSGLDDAIRSCLDSRIPFAARCSPPQSPHIAGAIETAAHRRAVS